MASKEANSLMYCCDDRSSLAGIMRATLEWRPCPYHLDVSESQLKRVGVTRICYLIGIVMIYRIPDDPSDGCGQRGCKIRLVTSMSILVLEGCYMSVFGIINRAVKSSVAFQGHLSAFNLRSPGYL